jgi:methionyl-tRNA formyltransferase
MALRVALICEEAAGVRVLQAVVRGGYELVALLTSQPGAGNGAGRVWALAKTLGYDPIPARRVREPAFSEHLSRIGVDVLLNVHSLHVIPEAVLHSPRIGAFNVHPGPLPRYAGLNAPSWAIYHGETLHGVTIHRMDAGIDTGPIVYQEMFPIEPNDTGLSVALRCAQKGVVLASRLLETATADPSALPLTPQDVTARQYFGRQVPREGWVAWNEPARQIHDFVRACDYDPFSSPWGAPRTRLGGEEIGILKVALTDLPCDAPPGTVAGNPERPIVATGDHWIAIRRLTGPGRSVPAGEVLRAGMRLE